MTTHYHKTVVIISYFRNKNKFFTLTVLTCDASLHNFSDADTAQPSSYYHLCRSQLDDICTYIYIRTQMAFSHSVPQLRCQSLAISRNLRPALRRQGLLVVKSVYLGSNVVVFARVLIRSFYRRSGVTGARSHNET